MIAFTMIFFWVPETKQRTLEELDYVFAVPTTKHMRYQATKAFPYWFKRYVTFNKNAKLEPLYTFDKVASEATRSASVVEYNQNQRKRSI